MVRDPKLVSVIIPCYNHGRYVREAIDSILCQTYREFEILVVNDGSDDPETIDVLNGIDHPRVTVCHKENGHLSSARNHGIVRSRGTYILPLDADDKFAPTFIEEAVNVLEGAREIGVVTCHVERFGSGRTAPFLPKGGGVSNFLLQNNCCGNALFRYDCWEAAGGYNEEMRGFEDWDFWLGVTKRGWQIHVIPQSLFFYRDTPGSMYKSALDRRPELVKAIVERHSEVFRENVVEVIYGKELEIQDLKRRVRELKRHTLRSLATKMKRVLISPRGSQKS